LVVLLISNGKRIVSSLIPSTRMNTIV